MSQVSEIMSFLAELKAPTKTTMQDLVDYHLRTYLMAEQIRLRQTKSEHEDYFKRWQDLYFPIIKLVESSCKILGFETTFDNTDNAFYMLDCTKKHSSKTCLITEQITVSALDTNPKDVPNALFKDDGCEDFSILGFGHYVYLKDIEIDDKLKTLFGNNGYSLFNNEIFHKDYVEKGIGVLAAVLKPGMEIFDELGIYTD